MRYGLIPLFITLSAVSAYAQSGPCTESAIQQGGLPAADDAFAYMPPYGKPVIGKPAIKAANTKSFSDRTNITSGWVGEHRIVPTSSGDMAYEYGTVHMAYDNKEEGHREFEAVILAVYKARGSVCQKSALTMQPLDAASEASANSTAQSTDEQAIRNVVEHGTIKHTDDEFFWSGAYEKPLIGKDEHDHAAKKLEAEAPRKNQALVQHPQRIVVSKSGDMAYEYGTGEMSFDDPKTGKHVAFESGYLRVWKSVDGEWKVAATMVRSVENTIQSK